MGDLEGLVEDEARRSGLALKTFNDLMTSWPLSSSRDALPPFSFSLPPPDLVLGVGLLDLKGLRDTFCLDEAGEDVGEDVAIIWEVKPSALRARAS